MTTDRQLAALRDEFARATGIPLSDATLRRAAERYEAAAWEPVETDPPESGDYLAWDDWDGVRPGYWDEDARTWTCGEFEVEPERWRRVPMTRPAPPAGDGGRGEGEG